MTTTWSTMDSPVGELLLAADDEGLRAALIGGAPQRGWERAEDGVLAQAREQLDAYFAGARRAFDLPLSRAHGTPWQRRVWDAVAAIPYGETCTYGELAAELGSPRSARAVGAANGRNPLCIVVPCHRVIGGDGSLTGYAGGLDAKRALLALERERTPDAALTARR